MDTELIKIGTWTKTTTADVAPISLPGHQQRVRRTVRTDGNGYLGTISGTTVFDEGGKAFTTPEAAAAAVAEIVDGPLITDFIRLCADLRAERDELAAADDRNHIHCGGMTHAAERIAAHVIELRKAAQR